MTKMKYFKKRRRLEWIELCAWESLYWEQHPGFLRSKKGSFLSTNLFLKRKALPKEPYFLSTGSFFRKKVL